MKCYRVYHSIENIVEPLSWTTFGFCTEIYVEFSTTIAKTTTYGFSR